LFSSFPFLPFSRLPFLFLTPVSHSADNEFYEIRHEKSRIMHDKEALQVVYEDLVEQYNSLKEEHVRSHVFRRTHRLSLHH
jgi:hypothetical protein